MVGRTLGHYRRLEKLGEGGMGETYRAEDTHLERHVALKVLPEAVASNRERLERLGRSRDSLVRRFMNSGVAYQAHKADPTKRRFAA